MEYITVKYVTVEYKWCVLYCLLQVVLCASNYEAENFSNGIMSLCLSNRVFAGGRIIFPDLRLYTCEQQTVTKTRRSLFSDITY